MSDSCKTGVQTKGCLNGNAPAALKWGTYKDTQKKLNEYLRKKNLKIPYKP